MPKDYDVEEAFRAIENELIDSMMRNLSHHRAEEMKEGLNWTSWQAEQLKALNVYKQKNQKKFTKVFADINRNIEKSILLHRRTGETEQEKAILEAIKKGAKLTHKAGSTIEGAFFRINDRKLDALLNEINASMRRAETAMLRMANDQYRKVIFNSQVYYNSGAGTYEKAVDMATKDFLSRGINCIQYKNGARVNIASYAGMALRTANTRAYCQGEGAKRQEWGITTVIVNKRGLPCPKCGRWTGKILIDDVWSGGKASDGPYPLMSQAMAGGLYHPNCKDGHTTYFPGISEKPEKVTKKEMKQAVVAEQQENRRNLIQRNVDKFDRLSTYSLDDGNKKQYAVRKEQWEEQAQSLKNDSEYQNKINERRAKWKKEHAAFDKEGTKAEINNIKSQIEEIQKQINASLEKEKPLEKKVYFDATGTEEEMKMLRQSVDERKKLQEKVDVLNKNMLDKQEIYKNEAQNRILNAGIVEEIDLSKRMTPKTVDALENELTRLKDKYGIMPKGIVFDPLKVTDATATYNWIDDKIYISNRFNDIDKYAGFIKKSENSLVQYRNKHDIINIQKEHLKNAEKILSDKSIKGYEREKAIISKAEAEIELNTQRMAVRENLMDALTHEYGHFIHRHANVDYVQKKSVFGAKDLGGKLINGDWKYDINTRYSATGKIDAAKISKYATENPYEAFAEGFLAKEKGQKIPESIEKVIEEAKAKAGVKNIEKLHSSDIMKSKVTSGALTDNNDPLYEKRNRHANSYYDSVRNSKKNNIINTIASNTGMAESDISKIYDHVFINEYELYGGKRRFDPDYDMAESFRRLREGKEIQEHDLILLRHERLEYELMNKEGMTYQEAHSIAETKYNYRKALDEFKHKNSLL